MSQKDRTDGFTNEPAEPLPVRLLPGRTSAISRRRVYWLVAGAVVLLLLPFVVVTGSFYYDASRYPPKEREYEQVELGMSEAEVLAILGPADYSSPEMVQGRYIGKAGIDFDRDFTVTRQRHIVNHFTSAYLEFDEAGVVHKSRPTRFGPRYPTLQYYIDWVATELHQIDF